MENSDILGELLPEVVFNPRPEPERRPEILVRFGILFASLSVLTVLTTQPNARLIFETVYDVYVFYVSLAMLFLFGFEIIVLGWYAADRPGDHNAATTIAIRVSQLILVVVAGLYNVKNR